MVVSDDDGPDFVDELEAELAARRPVPVQQDEPDDGYEVMCEPVAAMVEEVRAALVPVQQDEPCDECGCIGLCDPRCSQVDPDPTVPVQQDELQITPNDSKDLELGPVQQDEPEGVCAFPNCSCTENRCPGVGGEPCRGCGVPTGVGAYHHIGCRTPEPNPVPVQQEPDLRALRRREASFGTSRTDLPITPEPEDDGLRSVVEDALNDRLLGTVPAIARQVAGDTWAASDLGWREDKPMQVVYRCLAAAWAVAPPAVPSVGLRDRIAAEIDMRQQEFFARDHKTKWEDALSHDREFAFALTDAVLSVLHEAGTQGDWQQARTVRHLLDRIIDGSMANGPTDEDINSAESVTGWIAVASPGPAEAGTQEDET